MAGTVEAKTILEKLVQSGELAGKASHIVDEVKAALTSNTGLCKDLIWHGTDTKYLDSQGMSADSVIETFRTYSHVYHHSSSIPTELSAPQLVQALMRGLSYGRRSKVKNAFFMCTEAYPLSLIASAMLGSDRNVSSVPVLAVWVVLALRTARNISRLMF